jgi:hypothetical protein
LWKSRPAAPAITTRIRVMHKAYSLTQTDVLLLRSRP